ncbi:MAG: peptidylprolyl isomerase [Bacteroidales bacterium]|nr:peptidylprolyl isomerase [Bacteroidales bacterium]
MKKLVSLTLLALTLVSGNVFSQKNDYLLIVGNDTTTATEFLQTYQKNSSLEKATQKDLQDYLDLYIKFKLKVADGLAKQVDTAKSFKRELNSYRTQSAQQYLVDKEVTEELLTEAYEHSKYDVRASHILFNCKGDNPSDTLAAYKKAMDVRKRIIAKELSFSEAAIKYSDDPSAKDQLQNGRTIPGNKGDLGYFTAFNMIYPFEVAVYNTPVGDISLPVRSQFGYHLIAVTDKVPAIESITIAQIYIADSLAKDGKMSETTKTKIDDIQKKLKSKTAFEELVLLYSEDKGTANEEKKGEVKPFSPQRRPGDFVKSCLGIKPGECSEPVATHDGWFIVKLKEVKKMEINDDYKLSLKNRIQRDQRSYKSKESMVEKLKKEYHFNDNGAKTVIDFLGKNIPQEYMQSSNINLEELEGINNLKPMFTFADQTVTALDYAKYVRRFQGVSNITDMKKFVEDQYTFFVNESLLKYENKNLENKYPEFKALVKEYHEGMILYEITSSEVWLKAVKDTVGLEKFYETVKHKYPVSSKDKTPKSLDEVRSAVITEYQDALESKWIADLREKYPVIVNQTVFDNLLKK